MVAAIQEYDALSLLNGRSKRLHSYSYKLDGSSAQYGLDAVFRDDMECDEKNMSCWIYFADGHRRDGVGDLLEIGGIDCSRHIINPIALFDHGKTVSLPVGLTEDRNTKAYTVVLDPVSKVGKANVFFYQGTGMPGVERSKEFDHAVFCEQIFDLIVKRMIRAGSIGYQVKKAMPLQADYETGVPQGLHLLQTLMLEASAVVLPANGDTVRKMLAMPRVCGKPLSPYLVKSLTPYAVENTKVVSGYVPNTNPLGWDTIQSKEFSKKFKDLRMKYRKKSIQTKDLAPGEKVTLEDGRQGTIVSVGRGRTNDIKVRLTDGKEVEVSSFFIKQNKAQQKLGEANRQLPGGACVGDACGKSITPSSDLQSGQVIKIPKRESLGWFTISGVAFSPTKVFLELNSDKGEHIQQSWLLKENVETKSLPDIRHKYRTAKNYRRRLRKSVPGSSVLRISEKDMDATRELAESRGLKFQWTGSGGNGIEKVKLIGDDNVIDEVVKMYGKSLNGKKKVANKVKTKKLPIKTKGSNRVEDTGKIGKDGQRIYDLSPNSSELAAVAGPRKPTESESVEWLDSGTLPSGFRWVEDKEWSESQRKSIKGIKTKDFPPEEVVDEIPTDDVPVEEEVGEVEEKAEPYGASVLRRLHEDHSLLMKEYDEMLGPLEHEDVKNHLTGRLTDIEKHLTDTEKLWSKTYKDLPGLAGMEDEKDLTEDEAGEVADDAEEVAEGVEDLADDVVDETVDEESDKGFDTMDDGAIDADSGSEDEPTPDEVVEGMSKSLTVKEMKSLRMKYKKSCDCGKDPCECKHLKTKTIKTKGEEVPVPHGDMSETDVPPPEWEPGLGAKGLDDKETGVVGEASGFLNDISGKQMMEEEDRYKSYHYGKTLEGIGAVEEISTDATKSIPGSPEWEKEEANEPEHKMHPHRKCCKDAGGFLQSLASSRDFGEAHRQKAASWHKELDEIINGQKEEKGVEEEEMKIPEPGEMGQKSDDEKEEKEDKKEEETKRLKSAFEKQGKYLNELSKKLMALNGRF